MAISLMAGIYQYVQVFQTELVKGAYDENKKANGHSWSEMPCTEGLCIKDNKVGIGIEPIASSKKVNVVGDVDVVGNIQASGNISIPGSIKAASICLGDTGACISNIAAFVGSLPIAGGNGHDRGACTNTNSIDGTTKGVLVWEDESVYADYPTNPNVNGLSYPICQFKGSSCPTGWYQYDKWATTIVTECTNISPYCGYNSRCTTGSHVWGNIGKETCGYNVPNTNPGNCVPSGCCNLTGGTCYATVIKIGCF